MLDLRKKIDGKLKPMKDSLFVYNIEKGQRNKNSIYIPDDTDIGKLDHNYNHRGIRARWAQIYEVSETIDYLNKGWWILLKHGHWSTIIKIKDYKDNDLNLSFVNSKNVKEGILMYSETMPEFLKQYEEINI